MNTKEQEEEILRVEDYFDIDSLTEEDVKWMARDLRIPLSKEEIVD